MMKRLLCALLTAAMLVAGMAGALAEECETHTWSNGVCTECGYECQHPFSMLTYNPEKSWEEALPSVPENDSTHTDHYIIHDVFDCACGKEFVPPEDEGSAPGKPHSFENGVCMACGYKKGDVVCDHDWQDATCTAPRTCTKCGLTEGNKAEHSFSGATCTTPAKCTMCGATDGEALGHSWKDATCTEPKTCGRCGVTDGEALGHDWKDATCTEPKTCGRCGVTDGEALGHDWKAATCTAPKTCSECGVTEGSANGHSWKDATCTVPKTCSVCDETEGIPLSHDWQEATCTAPKTCSRCNATEGEKLPHSWNDGTCSECGASCPGHDYQQTGSTSEMSYEQWNDTQHKTKIAYFKTMTCLICGHSTQESGGEQEEFQNHEWANGKCTSCGYVCQHPFSMLTYNPEKSWEEALPSVPENDSTHTDHYIIHDVFNCDCGKEFVPQADPQSAPGKAHTFENDVCTACGYKKGEIVCDHVWTDATCTAPKTCSKCNTTVGEPKGHSWSDGECSVCGEPCSHEWNDATCTAVKTCGICGATDGEALGHDWKDATCTEPKTCGRCGVTEGDALGHSWKDATCTEPKTCSVCGTTVGEAKGHSWSNGECGVCGAACSHEWNDATCTAAKTCGICGATDGNALGHDWKDATCTAPKTCDRCGVTEGDANGHSWKGATCTEPKTCSVCGVTEGDALGHSWDDGICTVCGEVCQHPFSMLTYNPEKSWEEALPSVPESDSTHTDHYIIHDVFDCACGKEFVPPEAEGSAPGKPHSYTDGKCADCGHVCTHSSIEKDGDPIRTDGKAEYFNEDVHIQHYTYEQMMKCVTCGSKVQSLSGSGKDGSVLHVYVNDVCVCGAKKPAAPADDGGSTGGGNGGGNTTGGNNNGGNTTGGNNNGAAQAPEAEEEELIFEQTEPAPKPAMVEKLVETVTKAEAAGSEVKVEVVGAQQVMTETEYTQLKTLPVQEQILVTLASIGFKDAVSAAVETMNNVSLSDNAVSLMETVSTRMTEANTEEREQMETKLAKYFPVREIEVNGVSYPYFVMELQIEVDGELTIRRYGFRMDENGEWIFVMLDEI